MSFKRLNEHIRMITEDSSVKLVDITSVNRDSRHLAMLHITSTDYYIMLTQSEDSFFGKIFKKREIYKKTIIENSIQVFQTCHPVPVEKAIESIHETVGSILVFNLDIFLDREDEAV